MKFPFDYTNTQNNIQDSTDTEAKESADSDSDKSAMGHRRTRPVENELGQLSGNDKIWQMREKPNKWTDYLKEFILNGLFREHKVFFNNTQMEFHSDVYKRVKLHFSKGLDRVNERFELEDSSELVSEWWEKEGRVVLHKKMMEKKSNCLSELKKTMKRK